MNLCGGEELEGYLTSCLGATYGCPGFSRPICRLPACMVEIVLNLYRAPHVTGKALMPHLHRANVPGRVRANEPSKRHMGSSISACALQRDQHLPALLRSSTARARSAADSPSGPQRLPRCLSRSYFAQWPPMAFQCERGEAEVIARARATMAANRTGDRRLSVRVVLIFSSPIRRGASRSRTSSRRGRPPRRARPPWSPNEQYWNPKRHW